MKTVSAVVVRVVASTLEVNSVDFLTKNGLITNNAQQYRFVRYTFIDGQVLTVTRAENEKLLDVKFKLRPSRDDT